MMQMKRQQTLVNDIQTHRDFYRFAIVGIVSNLVIYGVYILLTSYGLGPKSAMTILYVVGLLLSFFLNRHWTFKRFKASKLTFIRYIAVYVVGYIINYSALFLFVDVWHFSHMLVQAIMIIVVACFAFVSVKLWVFNESNRV